MISAVENQTIVVSIIIPTLNKENSISRTLGAIAKMAEPVEVIVVDGGSRDMISVLRCGGINHEGADSFISDDSRNVNSDVDELALGESSAAQQPGGSRRKRSGFYA